MDDFFHGQLGAARLEDWLREKNGPRGLRMAPSHEDTLISVCPAAVTNAAEDPSGAV